MLGPRLRPGTRVSVRPRMRVVFLDQGLPDDKLVARLDGRPLRWHDHLRVRVFFVIYGLFKRMRYALRGRARGLTRVLRYDSA